MAAHARLRTIAISVCSALFLSTLVSADAMARPDARTMACAEVREIVFSRGAVVITTGDQTFDRFVESQRFCQPVDEISVPAIVETRDNPECWVGYVCRNRADRNTDR